MTRQYSRLVITVFFMALLAASIIVASAESGNTTATTMKSEKIDLGRKYCGNVEKKYGILPRGSKYDRIVGPKTIYIDVTGVIDTAMMDYVNSAIRTAERENAVLVLRLNTPGGYLDAALNIVTNISRARVPVIGYVTDRWAESAGTLILVSTHIAAMQPGTIIGSLQPVAYNPSTGGYEPINESKIINPIIKVLCEHGATRGRNATALVRFVLKNDNYGAEEALRYHIIDLVAGSLSDLISKVNGSVVALPSGDRVLISLDGSIERVPPGPRVTLLHTLSDPLLSGLLVSLGMLIVLFGLASGHYASAAIGALLLIMGLVGTGFNPNTASLVLLGLGALLLLIEFYTPGFGIIGGTGIAMIVLGIALLPLSSTGFAISPEYASSLIKAVYAIGASFAVITAFTVYKILQVRRRKPIVWSIIGETGKAIDRITPEEPGFVLVDGEYWKAVSRDQVIEPGDTVRVIAKDGPLLIVEKAESSQRRASTL
ncbi:MAG: nodulation protein NfeD [Desulfurococcales archaeon]|nr:nodulation protein NfeD [Desulfurococcales archaeon]